MYIRKKHIRVLVAMSGGVDSSVAVALLVRQGYDVVGAYMKQWDDRRTTDDGLRTTACPEPDRGACPDRSVGDDERPSVCSWKQDRRDAMRVAAHLGIELITLDFEKEYKEWVMTYMFQEYEKGRTPNPDVLCNKYIKFGAWLDKAREMGFDYLATGHYARRGREFQISNFKFQNTLKRAKDQHKDQTYFLHQLSQQQLKHVFFPIGHLQKSEVRQLARTFTLPTAEREESMGICFVGEVPMKEFLQQKIKPMPGHVVLSGGEIVGQHEGLAFYTIGQRHLGMQNLELRMKNSETKPLFVVEKRFHTNELVVGFSDDPLLFKKEIIIENMHWIAGQPPCFPLHCKVRLRHRQDMQDAVVARWTTDYGCEFTVPQRAVTPGQFAVLYKDNTCLGGGAIV